MAFLGGVAVGFVLGFFGFLLYVAAAAMNNAPEGYEDDDGFKYGREP